MLTTDPVAAHLAWLRMRGLSPRTVYDRSCALARMRAALPVPLLDATPADLAAWRAALVLSDQAVACYTSHARSFYAWALDEGLVSVNPAVGLPVPRRGRRLPRPVAEDDLLTALASAPDRVRPWLVLAAWCGLRAKEIAYLRREDVLDHARPPVLLVTEQAAKGGRERMVPMPPFVVAELRAARLPLAGYVFPRADGRPGPNQPWLVSRLACDALHSAGVPATLHQLRHRYGTQIYAATRDIRVTQELLGHQSVSTTAGYAAYDRGGAAGAAESLPCP